MRDGHIAGRQPGTAVQLSVRIEAANLDKPSKTTCLMAAGLLAAFSLLPAGAKAQGVARVIFEQPSAEQISDSFRVPHANKSQARLTRTTAGFMMISWQTNPDPNSGGLMVPVSCAKAGRYTGFFPPQPAANYQLGYRNTCGASLAQMQGRVVGVYLTSEDLPQGSHGNKMMITPEERFPEPIYIFASQGGAIETTLDLQAPVAQDMHNPGSHTYINADFLFKDRVSDKKVTFNVTLLSNGRPEPEDGPVRVDKDTSNYQLHAPLRADTRRVTRQPGSDVVQGAAWTGWKHFRFAITRDNFAGALAAVRQAYPEVDLSMNPDDFGLTRFHLNAEMRFTPQSPAPTRLGWSMRDAKIVWTSAPP